MADSSGDRYGRARGKDLIRGMSGDPRWTGTLASGHLVQDATASVAERERVLAVSFYLDPDDPVHSLDRLQDDIEYVAVLLDWDLRPAGAKLAAVSRRLTVADRCEQDSEGKRNKEWLQR